MAAGRPQLRVLGASAATVGRSPDLTGPILPAGKRLVVELALDLGADGPDEGVAYSATVSARALEGGAKRLVGSGEGRLHGRTPVIAVHSPGLPPGTWRVDAVVVLGEGSAALLEGLVLTAVA